METPRSRHASRKCHIARIMSGVKASAPRFGMPRILLSPEIRRHGRSRTRSDLSPVGEEPLNLRAVTPDPDAQLEREREPVLVERADLDRIRRRGVADE